MFNASKTGADQTGPLPPGTLLQNRYLIKQLLAEGGMGMVYLAEDRRLANRPCAIKEMVDHFIDPQQRLEANEYFAREADTLAQLKHSAIPVITDRFDDLNRHYLVMEHVEGRNLEEELAALGHPLSEGLVIDIGRQLCDVLAYLHGFTPPIVYRDMKPSNVMLTPKGKVMLIDFGIARLFKSAGKGTMIGTLGFAPPEQYQGHIDPRSDIYSLGAALHYLLTGRDPAKFPPFSFPPVRDLRPEVSGNLVKAIGRALAYKLDDRPQTIKEFRDMMLYGRGVEVADGVGVSSKSGTAQLRLVSPHAPVHPHRKKSRLRRATGVIVFSLVAAFATTYVYNSREVQTRMGSKAMIDSVPWKHEELIARAREHPLELNGISLRLSTRDGDPLSPPKTTFLDTELTNRYVAWNTFFQNKLAGLEGATHRVEARFYDASELQVASSRVSRFVGPSETVVDISGVALITGLSDHPLGQYKVALYLDDRLLAELPFTIAEDIVAKARAEAEKAERRQPRSTKKSGEKRRGGANQENSAGNKPSDPRHTEEFRTYEAPSTDRSRDGKGKDTDNFHGEWEQGK